MSDTGVRFDEEGNPIPKQPIHFNGIEFQQAMEARRAAQMLMVTDWKAHYDKAIARAEKAEWELGAAKEALSEAMTANCEARTRLSEVIAEKAAAMRELEIVEERLLKANVDAWNNQLQFEARLAEAAPVVEAAEALEPLILTMSVYMDGTDACVVGQKGTRPLAVLRNAVRALRAAQAKRKEVGK